MWLTAISSVTVLLHYLPRCLFRRVAKHTGLPFSDLKQTEIAHQKNLYSYNKNPESLCYKQKHMSELI